MSTGGRPQGTVETGRTFVRREYHCESCKTRQKVGVPKAGEGMWPARLHVNEKAIDLLLVAAVEFVELSTACLKCQHKPHQDGVCGYAPLVDDDSNRRMPPCRCDTYQPTDVDATAIDFVDWVRPDAISPVGTQSPVKAEPPPVSLAEKRRRHAAGAA